MISPNNKKTCVYMNNETDKYEMYLGADNFIVFETEPDYIIENRDYNKLNFDCVLKELMNGTQKILVSKMNIYESGNIDITQDPYYPEYMDMLREQTEIEEPLQVYEYAEDLGKEMVRRMIENFNNINDGMFSSANCPLDLEITSVVEPVLYKNKETGERKIIGYKNFMNYYISTKRSMDIIGDARDWLTKMRQQGNYYEATRLNSHKYSRYITDKIYYVIKRMVEEYKWCGETNFLGQRYFGMEEDKGKEHLECYCGDNVVNNIELFYVRCGVARNGRPMPNRRYKKDSHEFIDSPFSHKGTTYYLRKICGMNNVKRFTKMNKVELIKVLMKM